MERSELFAISSETALTLASNPKPFLFHGVYGVFYIRCP
jgi:hypothetical protein